MFFIDEIDRLFEARQIERALNVYRQRQVVATVIGVQRAQIPQQILLRAERCTPLLADGDGALGDHRPILNKFGQFAHRIVVKQIGDAEVAAKIARDKRHNLPHRQRMRAQVDECLCDIDLRTADRVGHDTLKDRLGFGFRLR
nr:MULTISPECIES: hypothetical protein [unclassified Haematospirillum]